jgi:hypothetical protein
LREQQPLAPGMDGQLMPQPQQQDRGQRLHPTGGPCPHAPERRHRAGAGIERALEQSLGKLRRQGMVAADHLLAGGGRLDKRQTNGTDEPACG